MSAAPPPEDAKATGGSSSEALAPTAPAASTPAALPQPAALYDDEHTRIDHYPPAAASDTVVITFDPLLYLWPKPPFGLDFLRNQGVAVVAVRRKAENFYQTLDRERFEQVLRPALTPYRRVLAYGSSLGAYAALYYCRDLDCEVIAPSPRVSVHPVHGTPAWQRQVPFRHEPFDAVRPARCRAVVIYDPREPRDRRYVEQEILPQFPTAQLVRVPFSGHPTTQFLGDIGFLPAYMRAVVAGRPPPRLDRRQRVHSATWFQVLAERCAQRGRLAVAESLIDRSLALRPNNMLALRTRGLVKTLQRHWPEAVAALQAALALDPADPLTISMLKRARLGATAAAVPQASTATATATATPGAGTRPRLAQRAWQWLRGRG